jgi:outer membrane protein OmpA-like peptidoglycan-associated protein
MKPAQTFQRGLAVLALAAVAWGPAAVRAADGLPEVDVGKSIPDASSIKEGLFPEDACKELEANGYKCMGFKPAIRYSLPASSFKLGSAEIPELLKQQLDVFADVLKAKKGSGRQVRVVGHADASGSPEANLVLSLKRAESVKAYLVQKGAEPEMLIAIGQGAKEPKNAADPYSAENRRVEIGRSLNE